MELDPDAISREWLRAIRGRRSQTAFARRLGYRSNVPYTWESGRRWPDATTLFQALARVGVDVPAAIRTFYRREPPWLADRDLGTAAGVSAMLADLQGDTPLGEIAARAGRNRFAVSRWLRGKAVPRLPDLLRLVEATSLRLLDFLAAFVDPATLPAAREHWQRLEAARNLAWSSPWAQGVLLGLELATYQALPAHDDAWLAARLGLDAELVRSSLVLLEGAGQVQKRGGRYVRVEVQAIDARRAIPGTGLKEFWSGVALERLRAGTRGTWSYNVFTVSDADYARIDEMQRAHYRAVRALVAESTPAERVVILNLQLVPLGG